MEVDVFNGFTMNLAFCFGQVIINPEDLFLDFILELCLAINIVADFT